MLRNTSKLIFVLVSISIFLFSTNSVSQVILKSLFVNPPEAAKPRAYWVWGQGNYDYTRISEELKAFKEAGMAGVDIYDMGIDDPYNIIPHGPAFFSNEQLDGVVYALKEAKKLGLKMGMSVSNGWNTGGDWTPIEERSMNMLFSKDTLQGPIKVSKLRFPYVPLDLTKIFGKYKLYPTFDTDGFPTYYENVSLVAYPLNDKGIISDLKSVITFDASKIKGNTVDIQLPEGKWVLLRSIVTPMGQKLWAAGRDSKGYIMDHFSPITTKNHLNYLFDKLEARMGSLKGSAMERLYLASFESEAAVEWTPTLSDYFYKLNGYRIEPFIPALSGEKVIDEETTQRFIHDYRCAISEMFVSNHYLQARQMCHDHGIEIASESGGPGPPLHRVPTEDAKALGAVDVMRGEFWNMTNMTKDARGGDLLSVIKNIASAAHIYGHKVVEMEAFTSQGKHWNENPLMFKKLADYAFCNGMTRVIYHTSPHSPKEAGVPGWSYGAGTHFSPNLSWWSFAKNLNEYFARISALLQQGNFVADVAYYKGEEVPNFSIGYKYEKEGLGAGFDYDDLNTDILLKTTEVVDGKIKLPCGMTYSVLVLKDNGRMNIEVLRKIEELISKGATIIGNKPTKVFGYNNYVQREIELKQLADKIWGANPAKKQIRSYGKGQIVSGYTERKMLTSKGILPDFSYTISPKSSKLDYIHRSTETEEIYFVRNMDSIPVSTQVNLRTKGLQPQLWNPIDGSITHLAVYADSKEGTVLTLEMDAFGSCFIVFSKEKLADLHVSSISKAGKLVFPSTLSESLGCVVSTGNEGLKLTSNTDASYQIILSDKSKKTADIKNSKSEFPLTKPWDVRFTYGWGFNPIQKFDSLVDWTKHPDKALSHYSGTASYKMAFTLPVGFLAKENAYTLELGTVGEMARVYLNGEEVGVSLFPPHRVKLGNSLRDGENNIVIEVANTWQNQLTFDNSVVPSDTQRLRSNLKGSKQFTKGDRPWTIVKPLASGLIGPVKITSSASIILK